MKNFERYLIIIIAFYKKLKKGKNMNRETLFMDPKSEKEIEENKKEGKADDVASDAINEGKEKESLSKEEQAPANPPEQAIEVDEKLEKKEVSAPGENIEKRISIDKALKVINEETFNIERGIKASFSEITSFGSGERKKLARFGQTTEDLRNRTRDRGLDSLMNDFHEIF